MPRLSRNQREPAIERLGAGQSAQLVANAYNVTVCNIDIIAPTSSTSHHTTTRLLYSAPTFARPVHHDNSDGSSYHWNTATTHQCRHRPSPLGLQQYPLSMSCSRSCYYKPTLTGTTAMGHISSTLALSAMEKSSVFRRRMAEYGSGEEEVNVTQMHV